MPKSEEAQEQTQAHSLQNTLNSTKEDTTDVFIQAALNIQKLVDKVTEILEDLTLLDAQNVNAKLEEIRQEALAIAGNPLDDAQMQEKLEQIQTALNSALAEIKANGGFNVEALRDEVQKALASLNTEEITSLINAGKAQLETLNTTAQEALSGLKETGVSEINARIEFGIKEIKKAIAEGGITASYTQERKLFDMYQYSAPASLAGAYWVDLEGGEDKESPLHFKRIKYIGNNANVNRGLSLSGFENAGLVNTITIPEGEKCVEVWGDWGNIIALSEDRTSLYVLGANTNGQLGVGNKSKVTTMQRVFVARDIEEVLTNPYNTIVKTKSGALYICGHSATPTFQKLTDGVKHFWWASGYGVSGYVCLNVIKDDGKMYAWIKNAGALVTHANYEKTAPAVSKVIQDSGLRYIYPLCISENSTKTEAMQNFSSASFKKIWQSYGNRQYALGIDTSNNLYLNTTKVLEKVKDAKSFWNHTSGQTTLALKEDGTLWASGLSRFGGGTQSAVVATWEQVSEGVKEIGVCPNNAYLLKEDGEIYGCLPFASNGKWTKLTGN